MKRWLVGLLLVVLAGVLLVINGSDPIAVAFFVFVACVVVWAEYRRWRDRGRRSIRGASLKNKPEDPPKNYAGRVILVVIFALPGALLALFLGVMTFAFAGDGGPFTEFEVLCWFLWAGVGGACLGASPGLLMALVLRVWWVLPALGAAAGFALSWGWSISTVPMGARFVLVGLVVGLVLLVLVVLQGNRRRGGRESQQARGGMVPLPQRTDEPVGRGG